MTSRKIHTAVLFFYMLIELLKDCATDLNPWALNPCSHELVSSTPLELKKNQPQMNESRYLWGKSPVKPELEISILKSQVNII